MFITYKHKGTKYHVAVCQNCEASMTMTGRQFAELHSGTKTLCLELFDAMECCDKPDFYWEVKDVE